MAGKTGHQDIARRYALAVFALARGNNALDHVSKDLQSLQAMLAASADLQKFISNTTLPRDAQASAILALADKAGFSSLTKKFLGTLAQKRRLAVLPEIISSVQAQVEYYRGEVTAEITSAQAIDNTQAGNIAAALKKALGVNVNLTLKQDADIMGGLIVRIGSQLIDSSVKSKLERLHRSMKSSNASSNNPKKIREVA